MFASLVVEYIMRESASFVLIAIQLLSPATQMIRNSSKAGDPTPCRLHPYRGFPDSARSIRSRPELGILYIPALAVVPSPIKAMHRPSCAHVVSRGGHVVSAIFTADMIWRSTHVKVHSTRAESSRARQAGAGQSATMTAGCPHRCSLLAFVLVT